jgi:hypothetical protein
LRLLDRLVNESSGQSWSSDAGRRGFLEREIVAIADPQSDRYQLDQGHREGCE